MSSKRLELLPYGAHTYSKSDARWWPGAPVIVRGQGSRVWDEEGREYVDLGMGINNVLIGHAEASIDEAAIAALRGGQAFSRPSVLEEQAAEAVLRLWPAGEQIIFTKSGSSANDAAIKLARAVTDRPHVAFDGTAPFFSTSDWWCSHQPKWAGTLDAERGFALPFRYNDVESVHRVFEQRPLAAVILEPARFERPKPEFVQTINDLCRSTDTLLILDCVVVGYRYGFGEAFFGFEPDLFTLGKGMANGYSVAALVGKRRYMSRGASDVFLLSTTNGAERSGLAAAIATAEFYRTHAVIAALDRAGYYIRLNATSAAFEASAPVSIDTAFNCRPKLVVGDAHKVAFSQALADYGVLLPPNWCCVCFRHTAEDLERFDRAVIQACQRLARAV